MADTKVWRLLVPVFLAIATAVIDLCNWHIVGFYSVTQLGLNSAVLGLSCLIFALAFASIFAAWLKWFVLVLAVTNAAVAIASAALLTQEGYYYDLDLGLEWGMAASAVLCAVSWPFTTCSISYTVDKCGLKNSSV